jgi:hypothetical protein
MTKISASIAAAGLSALLLAAALPAQTTDAAAPSSAVSKVRIVRLSQVNGTVQLDRATGHGFETAVTNMPIVENSRLMTGDGVAEVEFEDNSTLRLAPDSMVEFPRLERLPAGTTASSVELVKGIAYVSLLKTQGNQFNLLFGRQKVQLTPSSHIRLQVDGAEAKLAVLDGTLQIDDPSGPMDVTRNKTVSFNLRSQNQDQAQPSIAKNVASFSALDSWDQKAAKYHAQTVPASALNNSPYAYGLDDMSYYGSFMNAGGCGMMWRPYFASAAWDPYSNGVWAWYQGAGYSWVSPYPWGWTPYHYGSWSMCPGVGWGWQPGGAWNGLNNIATGPVTGPGRLPINGPGGPPVRPPRSPIAGEPTLRVVSRTPLVRSEAASDDSFVFRKDSAGLGIPREDLGNLNKLSQRALNRGTATTAIYTSAPFSEAANGRPSGSQAGGNSQRQEPSRSYEPAQRSSANEPSHMDSGGGANRGSTSSGPAPASGHPR